MLAPFSLILVLRSSLSFGYLRFLVFLMICNEIVSDCIFSAMLRFQALHRFLPLQPFPSESNPPSRFILELFIVIYFV
jgi:hypothetical protein